MLIIRVSATGLPHEEQLYGFQNFAGIFNPLYNVIVASCQGVPFHFLSVYKAGRRFNICRGVIEFQRIALCFLNSKESIIYIVDGQWMSGVKVDGWRDREHSHFSRKFLVTAEQYFIFLGKIKTKNVRAWVLRGLSLSNNYSLINFEINFSWFRQD